MGTSVQMKPTYDVTVSWVLVALGGLGGFLGASSGSSLLGLVSGVVWAFGVILQFRIALGRRRVLR